MTLVYFDSSALVKLLLDEPGTPMVEELWDKSDGVLASRLAYPEVRSALSAAARNHQIDEDVLDEAEKTPTLYTSRAHWRSTTRVWS
jgi:uncharacterized protein